VRPFLFVVKGQPKGQVKEFIDFVLGPKGQEVLNKEGLLSPIVK
jgi:phosphate transport system substrate-binding protein